MHPPQACPAGLFLPAEAALDDRGDALGRWGSTLTPPCAQRAAKPIAMRISQRYPCLSAP